MPATDRASALRRVYQDALDAGLDEEGARVAVAIAVTEAGYGGAQGDRDIGGSRGTFQFYFGGGQGNNFAKANGLSEAEADRLLARDPHAGNRWALEGYLGQAIRDGQAKGLHGSDLATYAQRYGQRSVSPERSGANYQTVSFEGGEMDRPPSEFEPPSRFASPASAPSGRSGRMQSRIDDLRRQRAATQAQVEALLKPGPDETPSTPEERLNPLWQAQADQARKNRELELAHRRAELGQVDTALRQVETDLANDPDPKDAASKPKDPMQAEADRLAVEQAAFNLAEAKRKAGAATSPEERRLAELEVRKAELGVQQAELNLERTRNPLPPQRAPRYPDEIAQSEASAANSRASAERTTALLPGEVAKQEADLTKARRDLMPEQQRMLQSHLDTVKYLQGMLERGEIDPSQADAYVRLSREATEAGLRGTTPFQEAQDRRTGQRDRQRLGIDLLNQRMSSGQGLASSLLSAASNLAGQAVFKPGQTSLGVDPLAQLMPLLAQLQGGTDVAPFARGLLMGGQEPAPSPVGALPAGL